MGKIHNTNNMLDYWNQEKVESMYDKNLLNLEIRLIKDRITRNSKILDAGCGEGEPTLEYSTIPGVRIHAADFSETRLKKAAKRLTARKNVILKKVDFLGKYSLDKDYDFVISQRFLINLMEWRLQKKVLRDLGSMLKKGGRLILLEGSLEGARSLNSLRRAFGLAPIPIKWHNLFLSDKKLVEFMEINNMKLIDHDGLGDFFMLTRGIRPYFDKDLNWNSDFNKIASSKTVKQILQLATTCSRLKVWVFQRTQ